LKITAYVFEFLITSAMVPSNDSTSFVVLKMNNKIIACKFIK